MIRYTKFLLPILAGIMMSFIFMFFPEPAHAGTAYEREFDDSVDYTSFLGHRLYYDEWYEFARVDSGIAYADIEIPVYSTLFEHSSINVRGEYYFNFDEPVWQRGDSMLYFEFWFDIYGQSCGNYSGFSEGRLYYETASGTWDSFGEVIVMTDSDGWQHAIFQADFAPADVRVIKFELYGNFLFDWYDCDLFDVPSDTVCFTSAYNIYASGEEYVPVTVPDDYYDDSITTSKNIFQRIGDIFKSLLDLPGKIAASLKIYFQDIEDAVLGIPGKLKTYFDDLKTAVLGIPDKLKTYFEDLKTAVLGIPDKLKTYFEDLKTAVLGIPDKLKTYFEDLKTAIFGIPDKLKIILVELFVPDKEFLNNLVEDFLDRFPFIDVVINAAHILYSLIGDISDGSCPEPLVVSMEYMGKPMDITILDLSWYEPYKPTVDLFLTGFIVFGFVWNLFFHMPGILGGLPAVISKAPTDSGNSGSADIKGGSGKGGGKS